MGPQIIWWAKIDRVDGSFHGNSEKWFLTVKPRKEWPYGQNRDLHKLACMIMIVAFSSHVTSPLYTVFNRTDSLWLLGERAFSAGKKLTFHAIFSSIFFTFRPKKLVSMIITVGSHGRLINIVVTYAVDSIFGRKTREKQFTAKNGTCSTCQRDLIKWRVSFSLFVIVSPQKDLFTDINFILML